MNTKFIFSTNHADPSLDSTWAGTGFFEAVLLSAKYSANSTINKVLKAKANGSLVLSDNGNFSRMSKVAQPFIEKGKLLLADAEKEFEANGKLPEGIYAKRSLLFQEVVVACTLEMGKINYLALVQEQLKCNPDYLIGFENLVIPVLDMSELLNPVYNPQPEEILAFQKDTLNLYLWEKSSTFGFEERFKTIRNYLVLHSFDYASANRGARLLYRTPVDGIAISFGGPMASTEYLRFIRVFNGVKTFPKALPESYLIAMALTMGVVAGLRKKSIPVHILGLGSPILIVLLGYLLRRSNAVSIDATSTFKDSDDGKVYATEPAFVKLDMFKVAAFCLIRNEPYFIDSPFFKTFEAKHPPDWNGLRTLLRVDANADASKLAKTLEEKTDLLEQYIPYFSKMRSGRDTLIKEVKQARAGSNYWVIKTICEQVRAKKGNKGKLRAWLDFELNRYYGVASQNFEDAVKEIVRWIDEQNY